MNLVRLLAPSLLVAVLVGTAPAFVVPASAAPRCDAPRSLADRRACDSAREGPQALRRFVTRTQGVYGLYFGDYMTGADIDGYYSRQAAQGGTEQRSEVAALPGTP